MTPNFAQGANSAIESAAALANCLHTLVRESISVHPPIADIKRCLQGYQRSRKVRITAIWKSAYDVVRLCTFKGAAEKFLALWVLPYSGDLAADMTMDLTIGSVTLDYLPVPQRTLVATMPYNKLLGVGQKRNRLFRAIRALPLLVIAYLFQSVKNKVFESSETIVLIRQAVAAGNVKLGDGRTVGLNSFFFHIPVFGHLFKEMVTAFLGSILDPIPNYQVITFLIDLAPVYAILLVECYRRGNCFTVMRL